MAFATDTYAGDGIKVEFDLTFDFIARDHVTVTRYGRNSMDTVVLTPITSGEPTIDEFIWESDSKIRVGAAPGNGFTLEIVRNTPDTKQIVQWNDGSYIVADDLNTEGEQFLYLIQELDDTVSALDRETNADLDALEERVEKNEGDIKDLQDKDTSLDGDIAALDSRVTKNEGDIANLDQGLTQLGEYVDVVEAKVDQNTSDIAALDQGLTDLGNNLTDVWFPKIDKNTSDIAALDGRVTTNEGNISTNTDDIAQLKQDVSDNADEIDDLKTKSGVSKIVAGTNVTIDPADGKGDVTINADAAPYTLPIASASVLGGIKVGANLSISGSGVLSATGGSGGGGTIVYKGLADFTASAPANPAAGDLYLNDTAGTGAWSGFDGVAVEVDDRAFFNGADWDRLPGAGAPTLQEVTDKGNTTTNDIETGAITAAGDIQQAGDPEDGGAEGFKVTKGKIITTRDESDDVFLAYTKDDPQAKVLIKGKGSITAAGSVVSDDYMQVNGTAGSSSFIVNSGTTPKVKIYPEYLAGGTDLDKGNTIKLDFADGTGTFKGDVAVGDSSTTFRTIAAVIAALPEGIRTKFADALAAWETAGTLDLEDPTTLPADDELREAIIRATTLGLINLNGDDGSMTAAGRKFVVSPGGQIDNENYIQCKRFATYSGLAFELNGANYSFASWNKEDKKDIKFAVGLDGAVTAKGDISFGYKTTEDGKKTRGLALIASSGNVYQNVVDDTADGYVLRSGGSQRVKLGGDGTITAIAYDLEALESLPS